MIPLSAQSLPHTCSACQSIFLEKLNLVDSIMKPEYGFYKLSLEVITQAELGCVGGARPVSRLRPWTVGSLCSGPPAHPATCRCAQRLTKGGHGGRFCPLHGQQN